MHIIMLQATLCFIFNPEGQILLCMKKRGFGEGKWNGAGGKQVDLETIEQTAIREFQEETGVWITEDQLSKHGLLHFSRPHKPEWNQTVHVFIGKQYTGIPTESEEMLPQWRDINTIPYESMWPDDIIWLPRLLQNELFEYEFIFDEANTIYSHKMIQ